MIVHNINNISKHYMDKSSNHTPMYNCIDCSYRNMCKTDKCIKPNDTFKNILESYKQKG